MTGAALKKRIGFWCMVEQFFGPPSTILHAIRAVYMARSGGRCTRCSAPDSKERPLNLGRLLSTTPPRSDWKLVTWLLKNNFPESMAMTCKSCIQKRAAEWARVKTRKAKGKPAPAPRHVFPPLVPSTLVPRSPALTIWRYGDPSPFREDNDRHLGFQADTRPVFTRGTTEVLEAPLYIDASTVMSLAAGAHTLLGSVAGLRKVGKDDAPSRGFHWYVWGGTKWTPWQLGQSIAEGTEPTAFLQWIEAAICAGWADHLRGSLEFADDLEPAERVRLEALANAAAPGTIPTDAAEPAPPSPAPPSLSLEERAVHDAEARVQKSPNSFDAKQRLEAARKTLAEKRDAVAAPGAAPTLSPSPTAWTNGGLR